MRIAHGVHPTLLAAALLLPVPAPAQENSAPELSAAERAWLTEHGTIRIGVSEGEGPTLDMVGESGEYLGITADYLRAIRDRFGLKGLKVEIVRLKTPDQVLQALRTGSVELAGSIARAPGLESYLVFSPPYYRSLGVSVARRDDRSVRGLDDLRTKRVAVE